MVIFKESNHVYVFEFLAFNKGCHTVMEIHKGSEISYRNINLILLYLYKLKLLKRIKYLTANSTYSYKYTLNNNNKQTILIKKIMLKLSKR